DCAHGAGLAVIMPAWMEHVYPHNVLRFAQAAVRIWGCQMDFEDPENTAKEGIVRFRQFLRSIGMPLTFAELGAKPEDIPALVEKFGIGDGKTGGFVKLSAEDITKIYEIAVDPKLI
nr:iron-containing alcohol dehydrogenase [Oscillospiraceae bacterium]